MRASAVAERLGAGELLAGALVAVHLATGFVAVRIGVDWLHALLLLRSRSLRIAVGGQYGPLIPRDPWRLATCVLLHVDGLHLTLNTLAVLALGRALEPWLGRFRVVAWFCGTGVAGALTTHLAGAVQSDGASGGAFGLLAAGPVLAWRLRGSLDPRERRLLGPVFGGFLVANLVVSFLIPAIDPIAHLGGAVAGAGWAALPDRVGATSLVAAKETAEALAVGLFVGVCAYGWTLGG